MKAKLILMTAVLFFITGIASAFSVPYYNKASKNYTFEVKINGSTREIRVKVITTCTAHCPHSANKCEIKSSCGWVEVKNGQKVIIKDGCLEID
tara:strand:+ start:116 stop:397 length:282 start_codon:yes stop_codon:yes gene_type:complete